jgi:hypothetical protein
MSSTRKSSSVILQIQRRAQNRHIPKSILNILLAIDSNGTKVRKGALESTLGVTIHQEALVKSEDMRLIFHDEETGHRKKTFLYSLTKKGHSLLESILTGKALK